MDTLRKNWRKLIIIVLLTLIIRVLFIQLLPLNTSSTFALAPSILSQKIGLTPTAAIVITLCYTVIASVLIICQENLYGSKLKRMFLCSFPFSFIWFMGVLESAAALDKPLLPELLIGLTDIFPLLIMGVTISVWFHTQQQNEISTNKPVVFCIPIIASIYLVRRYFLYAVIGVNSGYASNEIATFWWTLGMGLAIGSAYALLQKGVKGSSPLSRSLWFGCIAFGLYWALNNFFMPIVFDMAFIQFSPTIMNYVYRIVIDIVFVVLGVWIFENSYST